MSPARRYSVIRTVPALLLGSSLLAVTLIGCNPAPGPDVLATVNGKQIAAADVDRALKQDTDNSAPAPSKEELAIHRLAILHGLIQDEIIQQRAAKLNLVATDEEVDAKVTDAKAPYTQEEFDRKLKERNQTLEDLRRDIRHQLTQNKLINKEVESKINITDAEITNYFSSHKSDFNLIEPQYHLARIVVTNEPAKQVTNLQSSKAGNDMEAKKKIQTLRNHLDAGEDFSSIAARFSEDPTTSSNGGDTGFVYESQLRADPEVFNAINKLKVGQVTETLPISRGEGKDRKVIGYAIYLLIEKRPAGQREMSDPRVQQSIRQLLRNNHAQLLQNAYSEMLYNEAKIHNYYAEQLLKDGAH